MDGRTREGAGFRLALALAVVLLAAAWLAASRAGAEPGLRKAISMSSINHGGDYEDLTAHGNLDTIGQTGARWVRIWVRWDKVQLFPPSQLSWSSLDEPGNDLPGCGTGCGFRYVQSIDAQIAAARAAGLNVVLVTWHFPRWANGTEGKPADWAREDRGSASTPVERLKPMEYRIPIGQLGRTGYYGRYLDWLIGRYAPYRRNLALEIMNEPNHQLWPQQGPSTTADPYGPGPVVIDDYVGEMMETARAVLSARGHPLLLAGPGLSDRFGANSRLMTNFQTAVPDTLGVLQARGFKSSSNFVWTHHNYSDVERNIASPTRAEMTRDYLVGRWRGLGGTSAPKVWLTEGGARLGQSQAVDLASQAELVRLNWERMSAAPGIQMWTNYMLYADPTANSGLREARLGSAAPRPVWDVFRAFPANL
jgi:Cellulase (glycosyl hydrolase family 5)